MSFDQKKEVARVKSYLEGLVRQYGDWMQQTLDDESLQRDAVYARLVLNAKIFKEAGLIREYEEADVCAERYYGRSVVLIPSFPTYPVYLLNGVDRVVVCEGAMISSDTLSKNLAYLNAGKDNVYRFAINLQANEDFPHETVSNHVLHAFDHLLGGQTGHDFFNKYFREEDAE